MEPFRWPTLAESLLRDDPDWRMNASLAYQRGESYGYSAGYRRAAELIFKRLEETRGDDVDLLVFPFVFLWRQYLELMLKELIQVARSIETVGRGAPDPVPDTHSLIGLWYLLGPHLNRHVKTDDEDYAATLKIVQEFHDLDPSSYTFRYARKTQKAGGGPSVPQSLGAMNLKSLHEAMTAVGNYLEGVSALLEDTLQFQRDQYAEHVGSY